MVAVADKGRRKKTTHISLNEFVIVLKQTVITTGRFCEIVILFLFDFFMTDDKVFITMTRKGQVVKFLTVLWTFLIFF